MYSVSIHFDGEEVLYVSPTGETYPYSVSSQDPQCVEIYFNHQLVYSSINHQIFLSPDHPDFPALQTLLNEFTAS